MLKPHLFTESAAFVHYYPDRYYAVFTDTGVPEPTRVRKSAWWRTFTAGMLLKHNILSYRVHYRLLLSGQGIYRSARQAQPALFRCYICV